MAVTGQKPGQYSDLVGGFFILQTQQYNPLVRMPVTDDQLPEILVAGDYDPVIPTPLADRFCIGQSPGLVIHGINIMPLAFEPM